jgi:hypothetical protein
MLPEIQTLQIVFIPDFGMLLPLSDVKFIGIYHVHFTPIMDISLSTYVLC